MSPGIAMSSETSRASAFSSMVLRALPQSQREAGEHRELTGESFR